MPSTPRQHGLHLHPGTQVRWIELYVKWKLIGEVITTVLTLIVIVVVIWETWPSLRRKR